MTTIKFSSGSEAGARLAERRRKPALRERLRHIFLGCFAYDAMKMFGVYVGNCKVCKRERIFRA